jgi:hypothetical protein
MPTFVSLWLRGYVRILARSQLLTSPDRAFRSGRGLKTGRAGSPAEDFTPISVGFDSRALHPISCRTKSLGPYGGSTPRG